ncbi:MAG: hypothetical protein ACK2U9_17150 [Anaerolineae bacterium]
MNQPITRRRFCQGSAVALGASLDFPVSMAGYGFSRSPPGGGFDPARDLAGLAARHWSHDYAWVNAATDAAYRAAGELGQGYLAV